MSGGYVFSPSERILLLALMRDEGHRAEVLTGCAWAVLDRASRGLVITDTAAVAILEACQRWEEEQP